MHQEEKTVQFCFPCSHFHYGVIWLQLSQCFSNIISYSSHYSLLRPIKLVKEIFVKKLYVHRKETLDVRENVHLALLIEHLINLDKSFIKINLHFSLVVFDKCSSGGFWFTSCSRYSFTNVSNVLIAKGVTSTSVCFKRLWKFVKTPSTISKISITPSVVAVCWEQGQIIKKMS